MTELASFIQSGILEMYVLGCTTAEEAVLVEQMSLLHPEVREEIEQIGVALEQYGAVNAVAPSPTAEPFLMAVVDYSERLRKGEAPAEPPPVTEFSKVADYEEWLQRPDLQLSEKLDGAFAHIIGLTPRAVTAIVWLSRGAPPETHTTEIEKFLVAEGSCDITVGDKVHSLKPGDMLTIPLHVTHHVLVTSSYPCKIILERAAA